MLGSFFKLDKSVCKVLGGFRFSFMCFEVVWGGLGCWLGFCLIQIFLKANEGVADVFDLS